MKAKFPHLDFQYSDPERNFDRSKVKGVSAKLIKVKDPKYNVAIDTAGGGKVYRKSSMIGQIHFCFLVICSKFIG